jgi:hypothetical protein
MKKSLLFISALCLGASSGFAQLDNIPNANFDIWTNTVTPTSWGTLNGQNPGLGAITGSATQATGANIKGANTIALHTISYGGQTAPGAAISNGAIVAGLAPKYSGGFKFRERAVALTGISSYTAGATPTGDKPNVTVVLFRYVPAVMTGTVTTTPGHRDTLGGGAAQPVNTSWAHFSVPITYTKNGLKAIAPDSAVILLSSSGLTGGAVGSIFYVDSLAFNYGCTLNPAIVSTGSAQTQLPMPGDTLQVTGTHYSRTWTIYIPDTVTLVAPSPLTGAVFIDSTQISAAQITATPAITGATYTVTTDWPNGMIGAGTIACVTIAGDIPANAGNHYVTVTMTPLVWGKSSPTASIPNYVITATASPTGSVSYLKIGTGVGIASYDQNGFNVSQNQPNPFDGSTTVNFNCPVGGKVDFVVVDILGRQVYDTNINATAGSNSFTFTSDLASGTYFFSLTNGTQRITRKMVVAGH